MGDWAVAEPETSAQLARDYQISPANRMEWNVLRKYNENQLS